MYYIWYMKVVFDTYIKKLIVTIHFVAASYQYRKQFIID